MANPISARLNGDGYQARHFWQYALEMLDVNSGISNISYDFSDKKSFDDVVITYDPPRGQGRIARLKKHYMQIKWQATLGHEFGYEDLIDPKFINATSVSLLERLRDANNSTETGVRYSFITTARIKTGDPLLGLISGEDGVLRLDKLKIGGPRSKMGRVRTLWREVLGHATDDELFDTLENFAIRHGQLDMEQMRGKVAEVARSVGLHIDLKTNVASDFRFDALGGELIKRGFEEMSRSDLLTFLSQQGLTVAPTLRVNSSIELLMIKSFDRLVADLSKNQDGNVLLLTSLFEGRYLTNGKDWVQDITLPVGNFLREHAKRTHFLRLELDAHASIAFVCGRTLHLKSGVQTELVQHGRRGRELWHAKDGVGGKASLFDNNLAELGPGDDLAVAVSVAQSTEIAVRQYVGRNVPQIGKLLHCRLPSGPGQTRIEGGQHAAALSDQLTSAVREIRLANRIERVHLFIAAPNAFLFYLGQQAQALGSHKMYEYDFDGNRGGSYFPSV